MEVSFDWVEGFVREQSPFSLKDLIKQRRRWISGLRILVLDSTIHFRHRIVLALNLFLWQISWVAVLVTITNFVVGGSEFPSFLILTAGVLTGGYISMYLVGIYRNLIGIKMNLWRRAYIYIVTLLLVPVSAIVEASAVLYSFCSPVKTFDVIKK